MKAAVLQGKRNFSIAERPMPEIGEEEVLVRILVCGLCTSEFPEWESGSAHGSSMLGHESVGIIEKVGSRVTNVKPGDRVTGMIDRSFAEYAKADSRLVCKVPDSLTDEEAMGEPLSCMMSGALRTDIRLGDSAALVGAGYFGLGFMQLMLLKGPRSMIAIDARQEALENAKRFGAAELYLPHEIPPRYISESTVIREAANEELGIDVVAEAAGNQKSLDLSIVLLRQHGILSIPGYHQGMRNINMQLLNLKAATVINAHEVVIINRMDCLRRGLDLIKAGKLNTRDLATNEYSLNDINHGFRELEQKPKGYIKGFIRISHKI